MPLILFLMPPKLRAISPIALPLAIALNAVETPLIEAAIPRITNAFLPNVRNAIPAYNIISVRSLIVAANALTSLVNVNKSLIISAKTLPGPSSVAN